MSGDQVQWRWPGGARLAVSIVVNVEEGSEYSLADGDSITEPVDELGVALKKPVRNFGNESNYRYGLLTGFERVAGLLDDYDIPATFTAAALSLERAPHIAEYIGRGSHEACCHGWRWIHQFKFDANEERDFIRRARDSIKQSTGKRPVGWLSRYLHTERTRSLLAEEGFFYHMDDYSGDSPFRDTSGKQSIIVLPYALDTNDMKFWLEPALSTRDWLQYAVDTFSWLYDETSTEPRYMSLGLHLRIIGRPGRIGALKAFFEHLRTHDDIWIATREQIARHYDQQVPGS